MSANQPVEKTNRFVSFLADSWVAILVVILAIIFILQNQQSSTIRLLVVNVEAAQWLVFAIIFMGGGLTGWVLARRRAKRRGRRS